MRKPDIDSKWFFLLGVCVGGLSMHIFRTIITKRQKLKKVLLDMQPVKKLSDYTGRDYLIVAHGPAFPKNMILEIAENKHIVALDGAADYLSTLGILPNYILGDFDSIRNTEYWGIKKTFLELKEDSQPYLGNHGIHIIPAKNQDLTDLQKAIRFCDSKNAQSVHLVCATGGRYDHSLHNIRNLRSEYKKNRPIYLHTKSQTLQYVKDEKCKFAGQIGDYCGILAFPEGKFSSTGLEYNGDKYELKFGYSESACNRLKAPEANVEVSGEAILVMPGFFLSQRQHEETHPIERLSLLFTQARRVTSLFTIEQLVKAFPTEFANYIKPKLLHPQPSSEKILFSLADDEALKLVLSKIKPKL